MWFARISEFWNPPIKAFLNYFVVQSAYVSNVFFHPVPLYENTVTTEEKRVELAICAAAVGVH